MKFALYLAAAVALHAQTQPVQQDPDKARLEGQILNSATGEPLRKTRLTLRMNVAAPKDQNAPKPPETTYTVTSDATGKFEIPNVEPGDYQLTVNHDGFAQLRLGNLGNGKKADPILLNRADRKTGFTIKLVPYGAIAGVVLDEDGDPIRNLRVSAMVYRYTTNGRILEDVKSAESNDLGEYRLFDLPSGRYFVKINPRAVNLSGSKDDSSYAAVFYPGVPQVSGAIPQDVGPGQQLRGLSFNLRKTRPATIRGKVIAPPDAAVVNVGLMTVTDSGQSSTSTNVNDKKTGKFEFAGIPPGSIYVTGDYTLNGVRHDTFVPVEIGTSDIEVELRPIPAADIAGDISVEGDPAFDLTKLGLSLDGAASGHNTQGGSAIGKDGRLLIRGITPGKYRIAVNRIQGLYIKSIRWGTTDITDAPLDLIAGIPPRTELSIVLASDGGELTGAVANEKSEPVEGAMVTLVPTGQHRSRPFYKNANTDAAGHFSMKGIAPGSYKIFAWDQVNTNAVMYDPDFLRPYEGAGTMLEIQPKGKHTADLRLIINKEPDDRSR
jgi:hypothetical protein